MKLKCVLVNNGTLFIVNIDGDQCVSDLQEAIRTTPRLKISCAPEKLRLYMARTTDEEPWLRSTHTDLDRMAKGEVPEAIQAMMTSESYEMGGSDALSCYPLPGMKEARLETHLLVHMPKLTWVDQSEQDPVYALDNGKLFFGNRDQVVEQLLSIHQLSYHTSLRRDSYRHIPILDQQRGVGKTTFPYHYIRLLRRKWPDKTSHTALHSSICTAHTVMCHLESRAFTGKTSLPITMNAILADSVQRSLQEGTELSVLTLPFPKSSLAFVRDLVAAVGPLFVVLNRIGFAFSDDTMDEMASRDLFVRFCHEVLLPWTQVPGLFFVVLGHAPFLRHLKAKNTSLITKPWYLERLTLFRLEPPQIQDVLCRTFIKASLSTTLADRWFLSSSELVEEATSLLFDWSGGHPWTVWRLLREYTMYESFKTTPFETSVSALGWVSIATRGDGAISCSDGS